MTTVGERCQQPNWKYPFPSPKLLETRVFLRKIPTHPPKDQTELVQGIKLHLDLGHSLGLPSYWTLLLVAFKHSPEIARFPSSNANFLGVYLDHSDSLSQQDVRVSSESRFEFLAQIALEIVVEEGNNNFVKHRQEMETFPRSFGTGFWGWRKIKPILQTFRRNSHEEGETQLLRITFTLIGRRKDPLQIVPSSCANLLKKASLVSETIGVSIYELMRKRKRHSLSVSTKTEEDALLDLKEENNKFKIQLTTGFQQDVHKHVLSARSPVFARMFDTQMTEQLEKVVKIPNISSDALTCFLRHIYTGQSEVEWLAEPRIAAELVDASEKYWMEDLRQFCDENLIQAANERNCLQLLELASLHGLLVAEKYLSKYVEDCMRKAEAEMAGQAVS